MPGPITEEQFKDAIELWAPKFNLIRELWPSASIEESLKLMRVIEDRVGDIKEDEKSPPKNMKRLSHTEEVRQFDLKQERKTKKNTREF